MIQRSFLSKPPNILSIISIYIFLFYLLIDYVLYPLCYPSLSVIFICGVALVKFPLPSILHSPAILQPSVGSTVIFGDKVQQFHKDDHGNMCVFPVTPKHARTRWIPTRSTHDTTNEGFCWSSCILYRPKRQISARL